MINKVFIMTLAILIIAMSSQAQKAGTFVDSRDKKIYKTVTIGKQTWMAENLAYKADTGFWAYKNDLSNVAIYGYLYKWETAKTACPAGWHLPSDAEWTTLENAVGSNPGIKLKAKNGWNSDKNGTDDFGFKAIPGGECVGNGQFMSIGNSTYWWTSTENKVDRAWYHAIGESSAVGKNYYFKYLGYSVRCVKN